MKPLYLMAIHKGINPPRSRTTAWMQELEQRMEQLPKERKVLIVFFKEYLCVFAVKMALMDGH